MLLDAVLQRFIDHSPMAVAVRGAFEYALDPSHLDALFDRTVGPRDDRRLLFSTCVDLMATAVCRVKPSVHAAYQADDHVPVNVTALYARRDPGPGGRGAGPRPAHRRPARAGRPGDGRGGPGLHPRLPGEGARRE